METYSTTQASNIASIAGVIVLVANHFKLNLNVTDVVTLLGAVVAVVGIVTNYIHRYQKGDLTVTGFRKPNN